MKSFKKIAIAFGSLALGVGAVGVSAVSLQNKAVQANATSGSWVEATSIVSGLHYLITYTSGTTHYYMNPTGVALGTAGTTGVYFGFSTYTDISSLAENKGMKISGSEGAWTFADAYGATSLNIGYVYTKDKGFYSTADAISPSLSDNFDYRFSLAYDSTTLWKIKQAGTNTSKTNRYIYSKTTSGFGFTETSSSTCNFAIYEYKAVTSLTISGSPSKTKYISGETFNPEGLTVTATFNSGASSVVKNSDVTWSAATITEAVTSITATYGGVSSAAYSVSLSVGVLNSLAISGTPTKTKYVSGDSFDPTGLVVTGTYSDNSTATVLNSECTWNPATVTGSVTSTTATYGGIASAAYTISVGLKAISSLAYSGTLAKTVYFAGDSFDPTGLSFTVTYDDGSTDSVAATNIVWSSLASGATEAVGSYTDGGVTVQVTVTGITVIESSLIETDTFSGATTILPVQAAGSTAYSKAATVNNNRWSLTATGTEFGIGTYTGVDYLNIRQNSANVVANLHSNVFAGCKINRLVLDYYWGSNSATAKVTATVGSTSFGSATTQFDSVNSGAEFTASFENTSGAYGAINLKFDSWSGTKKTIYIKSIAVYGIADTTSDAAKAATFANKVELADGCASNSTLVSEYNALDASVKALADAYTIDDWADGATAKAAQTVVIGRCTVAQKMAAIVAITGSGSGTSLMIKNSDSSTYILAGLAGFACITIGGLFFLRKKKENA